MFSLIITIISIALVAALAVATIYYGGSAFTQGTAKANAAALVSAGQQINGALTLSANDNGGVRADATSLVTDQYMSAVPTVQGSVFTINATNIATGATVSDAVCKAVQLSAGVALGAIAANAAGVTGPYGCHAPAIAAPDTNTFIFKG